MEINVETRDSVGDGVLEERVINWHRETMLEMGRWCACESWDLVFALSPQLMHAILLSRGFDLSAGRRGVPQKRNTKRDKNGRVLALLMLIPW